MTLPAIGKTIDRLVERFLRRDLNRLLSTWTRQMAQGRLEHLWRFVVGLHGAGALASWRMHARWLASIGQIPEREFLLRMRQGALRNANTVEARALAVFREGQSPLAPERYITLVAGVTANRAFEEGGSLAAEAGDAQFKKWVRIYDTRVHRDWHDMLEGATIPINEKFVLPKGPNAGRAVDGPHDWNSLADPREWMNCGHGLIYVQEANLQELRQGARLRKRKK